MPKQEIKAKIDKGEATNEFSLGPFIFLFTVRTAITANLKDGGNFSSSTLLSFVMNDEWITFEYFRRN